MIRFTDWFGKSRSDLLDALGKDWSMITVDSKGKTVLVGPDRSVLLWCDDAGIITAVNDGTEKMSAHCYGVRNKERVYGKDNWVYACRGFGAITSDRVLMEFAKKVTSDWYNAGWHRTFEDYYLGDYALDHPRRDLTDAEYSRLKELQKEARDKAKAADEAREWKYVRTIYWADNSEEEIWVDKDGVEKSVMTVGPHGDLC